jgi:hypothetical protein
MKYINLSKKVINKSGVTARIRKFICDVKHARHVMSNSLHWSLPLREFRVALKSHN